LMVMTFWGKERFREAHVDDAHEDAHAAHGATDSQHAAEDVDEEEEHHHGPVEPHESPWVMTVPLVVLAVLSVVGGWVGIPYALSGGVVPNVFEQTLEPAVARVPEQ